MRSTLTFVALAAITLTLGLGAAPLAATPAASSAPAGSALRAAPYCGITWGSLPDVDPDYTGARIVNLRAGRHTCYDRLVVDLGPGLSPGYDVRYVSQVTLDGSGAALPLSGGAFLQVLVRAPAHDDYGRPTYSPADRYHAVNVSGFTTFRQVAWGATYEGQSTIGLGVRARLPFRTFVLRSADGGSRLVIDVAHRW